MKLAAAGLLAALALAAPAAASSRMVTTEPGVEIRVVESGPDNTLATLVLVPGWSTSAEVWREQIDHFSRSRRVISFDPRSQGASTKVTTGNNPDARARDLKAVLDEAKADRIVLVGWSQGVQDVAGYVNQFGTERLAGVVLVDAAIADGAAGIAKAPEAASQQIGMIDLYARAQEPFLHGMMEAIIITPEGRKRIDALVADGMKTPPSIGAATLLADLFGADRTAAIAKLDRPVLIVTSTRAQDLDAQKAMAARIPGARQEIVDGAGHAVFIDQPARFDALLEAFVEKLS